MLGGTSSPLSKPETDGLSETDISILDAKLTSIENKISTQGGKIRAEFTAKILKSYEYGERPIVSSIGEVVRNIWNKDLTKKEKKNYKSAWEVINAKNASTTDAIKTLLQDEDQTLGMEELISEIYEKFSDVIAYYLGAVSKKPLAPKPTLRARNLTGSSSGRSRVSLQPFGDVTYSFSFSNLLSLAAVDGTKVNLSLPMLANQPIEGGYSKDTPLTYLSAQATQAVGFWMVKNTSRDNHLINGAASGEKFHAEEKIMAVFGSEIASNLHGLGSKIANPGVILVLIISKSPCADKCCGLIQALLNEYPLLSIQLYVSNWYEIHTTDRHVEAYCRLQTEFGERINISQIDLAYITSEERSNSSSGSREDNIFYTIPSELREIIFACVKNFEEEDSKKEKRKSTFLKAAIKCRVNIGQFSPTRTPPASPTREASFNNLFGFYGSPDSEEEPESEELGSSASSSRGPSSMNIPASSSSAYAGYGGGAGSPTPRSREPSPTPRAASSPTLTSPGSLPRTPPSAGSSSPRPRGAPPTLNEPGTQQNKSQSFTTRHGKLIPVKVGTADRASRCKREGKEERHKTVTSKRSESRRE